MLNEFSKKEAPIQGLTGLGGGVPSRLLTLASGEVTYVDDVFSTFLYDGASQTATEINNGIDLAGEGGLVWIKCRSNDVSHHLFDTERGALKFLRSDDNNAEEDGPSLGSFDSDGFTHSGESNNTNLDINENNRTFCSWTFRKCPGFFDVVTYSGNGTSGRTISHNLGSVPGSIWVKRLNGTEPWTVYHRGTDSSAPEDHVLFLNLTSSKSNRADFADTAPTDSVFSVGNSDNTNGGGNTYVAYLFAHDDQSFGDDGDEAIIKCGSYTGTGTADFSEKTLGFEPQWVMVKRTDNIGPWLIADYVRGIFSDTSDDNLLQANASGTEADYKFNAINLTPRGFTTVNNVGSVNNQNDNYIYIAIRRPHKPPTAGTDVFALDTQNSGSYSSPPYYRSNFVVDATWRAYLPDVETRIASRMTGEKYMVSSSTNSESTNDLFKWDYMNGYGGSNVSGATTDVMTYMFKRAPGFFDVVCYEGTSNTSNNVNHNLGVVPNMMILKKRDGTSDWAVRTVDSAASGGDLDRTGFQLNSDSQIRNTGFQHAGLTATTFNPYYISTSDSGGNGTYGDNALNTSGSKYIAYLFASLSGVSKIGSYTGTGSDLDIDCGFTNGARFVLIKRTSGSTDWWVLDTLRGINAGNDPAFGLNQGSSNTSSYDLVDPYSSGFTAVGDTAAINSSGEKYIFLAIA